MINAEETRKLSSITVDDHLEIIGDQIKKAAINKQFDARIDPIPYGTVAQKYGKWALVFVLGFDWNEYFPDNTGKLVLNCLVENGFKIDYRSDSMWVTW